MLSATLKLLLRDLFAFFQQAEEALAAIGAERRCAQRLDGLSDRLIGMGQKINRLRDSMHAQTMSAAMDADLSLRESLKGLKLDIREIRCQLAAMERPALPPRLLRAFRRLSAIAEETYACADKLQWEIDDHDQRFQA